MTSPNASLDASPAVLDFIAGMEGLRLTLYNDPANHCSIGVGHLVHTGPITDADTKGPFGKGITKQQAMDLLHQDAQSAVRAVRDAVTVPLNQKQFDALVSFTFNVGVGNLRKSTLLQRVNAKDFAHVEEAFLLFTKAGGKVLNGLVRRRTAEAEMFLGQGGGGQQQPPSHWPPSRMLKRGTTGDDVKELQRRLHIGADGVFGPNTENAVKAFQRGHGLTADGIVGPKTAAKL